MGNLGKVQFEDQLRQIWKIEHNNRPLDPMEVRCLKMCGYYVMGGKQYKTTDTQTLPSGTAHIYVEFVGNDSDPYPEKYGNPEVKHVEVRDIESRKLLFTFPFQLDMEVLDILTSSSIYIPEYGNRDLNRFKQIAIDATEFDQDRSCYVYYGSVTGIIVNEKGFEI